MDQRLGTLVDIVDDLWVVLRSIVASTLNRFGDICPIK
jgi:hypothetical protein